MTGLLRDVRGTAEWLHNKLGGEDAWSAGAISNMLNDETLRNIAVCFGQLDSVVKVKVLLSFLAAPRSFFDESVASARLVLDAASADKDPWLQVL